MQYSARCVVHLHTGEGDIHEPVPSCSPPQQVRAGEVAGGRQRRAPGTVAGRRRRRRAHHRQLPQGHPVAAAIQGSQPQHSEGVPLANAAGVSTMRVGEPAACSRPVRQLCTIQPARLRSDRDNAMSMGAVWGRADPFARLAPSSSGSSEGPELSWRLAGIAIGPARNDGLPASRGGGAAVHRPAHWRMGGAVGAQ